MLPPSEGGPHSSPPQVQVSRYQNDPCASWAHADIYVFHCHTPYVVPVSIFLPVATTPGGCEENHRLSRRSTQQDDLPSVLCHSLSTVVARAEFCSGPYAAGKCFRLFELFEAEFSDTGVPGKQIVGADYSMGEFKRDEGERVGEQGKKSEK